jgi:hypothetical protein
VTDPTVSNARMSARSLAEPRERLPSCRLQYVNFEGRGASLRDTSLCSGERHLSCFWAFGYRYYALAGKTIFLDRQEGTHCIDEGSAVFEVRTNDPDEARATFNRGAEWVRTGEMA